MQPNLWIIIFRIVLNADEGAKERIKNSFQKIFKSDRWAIMIVARNRVPRNASRHWTIINFFIVFTLWFIILYIHCKKMNKYLVIIFHFQFFMQNIIWWSNWDLQFDIFIHFFWIFLRLKCGKFNKLEFFFNYHIFESLFDQFSISNIDSKLV